MQRIHQVWHWTLCFLPLTATLTLILTLIICNNIPNNAKSDELPQISELGTGQAHAAFAAGFILLFPQLLALIFGRLQFLIHSQDLISRWLLILIHIIPFLSSIFMLIMAIVSVDTNESLHLTGAFGMFGLISAYLLIHTMLIFYLWIRRSSASKHEQIYYFIYFIVCTLLLIIFFGIWAATAKAIPEYLASCAPFFYFIGFIPQFWLNRHYQYDHII